MSISFDELLEAVEELPVEAQTELVEVLRRRLAERGRQRVADDIQQARQQYASGQCKAASVEQIMREIES